FDPTLGRPCCTADDFQFDPLSFPRSPWNLSVANVFTRSFLLLYPNHPEQKVHAAWVRHSERLRTRYQELASTENQRAIVREVHRRQERRRNVSSLHLHIGLVGSVSPKAVDILDALGIEGMSSDESDHESGGGAPTYIASGLNWRSPALCAWLRAFDSLHLCMRYREGFKASAGAWPHYRVDGAKQSKRRPVRGLPRNCY
ncbi:hypothetical protein FOMPIDRAFT_1095873, partial [Fomitopsis schrenkii]